MFRAPFLTVRRPHDAEIVEFRRDGQKMTFGRDDQCDIVVPTRDNALSRLAGVIWRAERELWIRNLSFSHEMQVDSAGEPSSEPMRVRREDGADPGSARAVGAQTAYVSVRGALLLIVQQEWPVDPPADTGTGTPMTVRVSAVPEALRPVAAALCAPLFEGGRLPATYKEIVRRLGGPSYRQVRTQVEQICRRYESEVPALAARMAERRRQTEAELAVAEPPVLRNGLWIFPAGRGEEQRLPRALPLPDYYEVAHLLVRRHLITEADVDALGADPR